MKHAIIGMLVGAAAVSLHGQSVLGQGDSVTWYFEFVHDSTGTLNNPDWQGANDPGIAGLAIEEDGNWRTGGGPAVTHDAESAPLGASQFLCIPTSFRRKQVPGSGVFAVKIPTLRRKRQRWTKLRCAREAPAGHSMLDLPV